MLASLILSTVFINDEKFFIEKAVTPQEQAQGLSHRKVLANNHGMLFVFPKEENLSFWMHEMNFPLDIIWLNKNCKIIDISENQQPCEKNKACPAISPQKPSQYVLEMLGGRAEKYQLNIGHKLNIC